MGRNGPGRIIENDGSLGISPGSINPRSPGDNAVVIRASGVAIGDVTTGIYGGVTGFAIGGEAITCAACIGIRANINGGSGVDDYAARAGISGVDAGSLFPAAVMVPVMGATEPSAA